MKNNYYIGNSYIIANALIDINRLEGRNIIDDKDIENYKNILENKCITHNCDIRTYSDEKETLENDIMILSSMSGKVYCKIPGIKPEVLESKYRHNLPFGLTSLFQSIGRNEKLKRDTTDLLILKSKEIAFNKNYVVTPIVERKAKELRKEYYVSQK